MAYQERLNNIGNNIANMSTAGFKENTMSFNNLLYGEMYVNTAADPLTGYGVKAVPTGINFTQGAIQSSNTPLDFAIIGDGLFAVQNQTGTAYTRNGQFALGIVGDSVYLVSSSGDFVLDGKGQKITVDTSKGIDGIDFGNIIDSIGIYRFGNPNALTPLEDNTYLPSATSGAPILMAQGTYELRNSCFEQSGTNLTDAMSNMISAQRAYQMSARVLQTADENEQTINNLRK